jgi:hypothetical protein
VTLEVGFSGELWYWRGPPPWYFIPVPEAECGMLHDVSEFVSLAWGMIPVTVRLGSSEYDTILFQKDGRYLVPVKAAIRRAQDLDEGDRATVQLTVRGDL